MEFKLITNDKHSNHFTYLKKLAKDADTLIIVSPFVTDDFSNLIGEMKTIKKITLYTTLEKYADTAQKAVALYKFNDYCEYSNIDLIIKIDDNLHGKIYLFYNGITPKGMILTSGNFTANGLLHNHEYGVYIQDDKKQKEMADIIMSVNTYDLKKKQLDEIYAAALAFIQKNPVVEPAKLKVNKIINKKPSVTQKGAIKYFIKPVGTSKKPFLAPRIVEEHDEMGFGDYPKNMHTGDVLLLHSVGPGFIVGYYVLTSDDVENKKVDDDDRWPWKVQVECHSSKYSSNWWNYNLKTFDLVKEFKKLHPNKHITISGGDTLGALKWGSDRVQITDEFAQFIIERIPD